MSGIFLLLYSPPFSFILITSWRDGKWTENENSFLLFYLWEVVGRRLSHLIPFLSCLEKLRREISLFSIYFDYVSCFSHTFHIAQTRWPSSSFSSYILRSVEELRARDFLNFFFSDLRRPISTRWQWMKLFQLHKISNLHNTRMIGWFYRLLVRWINRKKGFDMLRWTREVFGKKIFGFSMDFMRFLGARYLRADMWNWKILFLLELVLILLTPTAARTAQELACFGVPDEVLGGRLFGTWVKVASFIFIRHSFFFFTCAIYEKFKFDFFCV